MQKPRSYGYDDDSETAREIYVEARDTWTGLYNHEGHRIHREPEPFGFQHDRWRNAMPGPNQKTARKTKKKGK